ncbi:MAG: FeoB-associated Cys-rich membrane protein [Fusobacteriaceae bacterium]
MKTILVFAIILVIIFFAAKNLLKFFKSKGDCGCCGKSNCSNRKVLK